MNSAEQTVYDVLSADPTIAAVVDGRIFHKVIPEGKALPAIAFVRSSTQYTNTIHNSQQVAADVGIDIHCISKSDSASQALADLVASTSLLKTNRADAFDPETETHSTVITVMVFES